jgi:hypothetical protein
LKYAFNRDSCYKSSNKYYFSENNNNLENKEIMLDCNLISYYVNDLETITVSTDVKKKMMESYISFIMINSK